MFDPSGFPKKGTKSVGVAKQWCGRLGKVENCQVGIYMGYVTRKEHALVNVRLYLNEEWAKDRARRKEAGVPKSIKFQTRHQLALEMLAECGEALPHTWIAGDDEMGRPSGFRQELRSSWPTLSARGPVEHIDSRHRGNRRRSTPDVGHAGSLRSCAWTNGARLCRRTLGPRSRCVTARKDRW